MKAPDKLYVAESRKIIGDIEHNVFSEQPFLRGSIEYIRKDLLLEWLENKVSLSYGVATDAFVEVIDKINSL